MAGLQTERRPGGSNRRAFVLISHGSGGSPRTHAHLARRLRERGLEVEVPLHEGNHREDNRLERSLENFEGRPKLLQRVLDEAGADEAVVIGHSLGAYSALVLAGAVARVGPQQIEMEADGRVKGLVLMAPSANWFAPEGALERVAVPVLLLTGGQDVITPATHGEILKRGVRHLEHVVIEGAGHYSFLSPFPIADGVDREPIFSRVEAFVRRVLGR